MQVVIVGRMPELHNSLSSAPEGLGKRSREGAECSSLTLTHVTGQGGMGCVLTCSTRAVGCHIPWPSLFLRGSPPLPAAGCSGKEGSGVAAWHEDGRDGCLEGSARCHHLECLCTDLPGCPCTPVSLGE